MKRVSDPYSDRPGRQVWHWQIEASDLGKLISQPGALHIPGGPYPVDEAWYRVGLEDIGRFIEVRWENGAGSWEFCEDPVRDALQRMNLLGLLGHRQKLDDPEIQQVKGLARNLARHL